MDLGLDGRTALVLAGSKGLGRGVASALAAEGVHVAIVARGAAGIDAAVADIVAAGGRATGYVADLADHAAMARAIADARRDIGPIDILVNNTGGPPPSGVAAIDPALWVAQFDAMIMSVIRATDAVLPDMRARRWGRILTMASSVVVEPNPILGVSNTLRSALVGWSKTLAGEVASDGITVNMLLPGLIATDRTVSLDTATAKTEGVSADEVARRRASAIPMGRYGHPHEFGAVAAFLASEVASYVTGTMMRVDGGLLRSV